MGTKIDLKTRQATQRVDDERRHRKVEKARKLIFKHGVGISGRRIKKILQDESLVPTRASNLCTNLTSITYYFISECLLYTVPRIYIQFFFDVCRGFTSRVRVGCVESNFHTPNAYPSCCRWYSSQRSQFQVCHNAFRNSNATHLILYTGTAKFLHLAGEQSDVFIKMHLQ